MATAETKVFPESHMAAATPRSTGCMPPSAATEPGSRVYYGDRLSLILWLTGAAILVALHVGQHVVYLLR